MPQPTHRRQLGADLGDRYGSERMPSALVVLCLPHITARFRQPYLKQQMGLPDTDSSS
jgi:hypothetical protein